MQLVIDFETSSLEWFTYGKEGSDFRVLCTAYKLNDGDATTTEDLSLVKELVEQADVLVMHNAQFDVGVLRVLGIDYTKALIVDTLILSKLYHNSLMQHGLDFISKKYLNDQKDNSALAAAVKELGLLKSKAQNPETVAKRNMGILYEYRKDVVCQYAIKDVELTYRLYKEIFFTSDHDPLFHSDLIKAMVQAQARGVVVDAQLAKNLYEEYSAKIAELEPKISAYIGDVSISSPKLGQVLLDLGYKVPTTQKINKAGDKYGSLSVDSEWLKSVDDDLTRMIVLCRKYNILLNTFITPIVEAAGDHDTIIIHPSVQIYGATETGRASSKNPNIQNIPKKRDEDTIGGEIRNMYLPFEGDTWYSIDFSGQESRLQVHYGALLKIKGSDMLVDGYRNIEGFDLHQKVAEIAGITRGAAKAINFGISYGMQDAKLKKTLKIDDHSASLILSKYYTEMPFLPTLIKLVETKAAKYKRIKTIDGRWLWCDYKGAVRKSFNKLIQGGSAGQTWRAIVNCYRAGIPMLFPVHDEINFSLSNPEYASKAKEIMETAIILEVPSKSELTQGRSWGECK